MKINRTLAVLALVLTSWSLYAQQPVKGQVTDVNGEPLMGVTIVVDGKPTMATDLEGNFVLEGVKPTSTVSATYIGFKEQMVKVGNQKVLKFVLAEDNARLDELVVVGYGTMKKNDLTGSVGSVEPKDLIQKGTPTLMEALQGTVPGVNITQSSSRAGGGFDIDIRGVSSLNSNTKPLYIVDGVACSDIQWLNTQDIERIDILKDASSTAIYGSRATAGVVMVTTKNGGGIGKKITKPTISYDGYYGVSKAVRMPDFQNAQEFYTYRLREFLTFAGETGGTAQPVYTMMDADFGQMALQREAGKNEFVLKEMLASGKVFDWPDYVTRDGKQQNHYLAVNGSTENTRYHIGLGYSQNKGLYEGDEERKINFKGSVDADLSKWVTAGFTVNVAKMNNEYGSDDGVRDAFRMNPFIYPFDEDGNLLETPGRHEVLGTSATGYQFTSGTNPLLYWNNEEKAKEAWTFLGNFYLNVNPIKGLNFKTTFSPIYSTSQTGQFVGTLLGAENNKASLSTSRGLSWTWDNVLTWDYTFKKIHRVNVMGLASLLSGESESESITAMAVRDGTKWYNLGSTTIPEGTVVSNSYSENSMLSYALRANYTLLNRYMLTATVRWDGCSKFADGYRWGSFPSVAAAWRISEETWMKECSGNWLNNLKLRLSYGLTGNNSGAGNYATQVSVSDTGYYPLGGTYIKGTAVSGIVNRELSWETSREFNVGLDFGFIGGRFYGSIDWYNKKSEDLLYQVDLPLLTGGQTMTTNIGSVRNRGIELALTSVNVATADWHWETSLTFSRNKNEVIDINGLGTDMPSSGMTGGLFIGHPVENVYAYEWDGIVTDKLMTVPNTQAAEDNGFVPGEKVRSCDYYYNVYGWQEGMPIIKDRDGDGKIDASNDRRVFSSSPKFTAGFTTNLIFKNWDFSASMYAKVGYTVSSPFYGQYLYLEDRGRMRLNSDWYVPAGTLLDCDGVNADGTLINPIYQETTHYGSYPFTTQALPYQEAWTGNANTLADASYLKVKHISVGYTFPKQWLDKFKCQSLRLYATVTNPFVFTEYRGYDPEWAGGSLQNDGPSTTNWQFGASIKF
ncbi:MAG: TonB-dependent receptor [Bacteroidaceae bacterium]|nr:TonB-dependent receptor [Bacteroidaceae bacterium]